LKKRSQIQQAQGRKIHSQSLFSNSLTKEKGVSMPEEFERLAEDWLYGHVTAIQASRDLGVSCSTFKRRAREWGAGQGLGALSAR